MVSRLLTVALMPLLLLLLMPVTPDVATAGQTQGEIYSN